MPSVIIVAPSLLAQRLPGPQPKPPVTAEPPIDAAATPHRAADILAEMLVEAGRQGTSWKPRPSSIIANRLDASITRSR